MNKTIKRKYTDKEEYSLGGTIGGIAGAVGAPFIGLPPQVGFTAGSQIGNFAEGQIAGSGEKERFEPVNYAQSSYGNFMNGGALNVNPIFDFTPVATSQVAEKKNYKKGGVPQYSPNPVNEIYKNSKSIGQDAREFKGKSHEQGGIDLNKNTEVEGQETIDNVAGQDYVFSKRLKVPGTYMTFAEAHKNLVKDNAPEEEINELAQLQEEVSGRK